MARTMAKPPGTATLGWSVILLSHKDAPLIMDIRAEKSRMYLQGLTQKNMGSGVFHQFLDRRLVEVKL